MLKTAERQRVLCTAKTHGGETENKLRLCCSGVPYKGAVTALQLNVFDNAYD